jgi:hypothetical protein
MVVSPFGRRLRCGQPQAVLGERPRGDYPQLDKVLRNDVKLAAPRDQCFKGAGNRLVLRMLNL